MIGDEKRKKGETQGTFIYFNSITPNTSKRFPTSEFNLLIKKIRTKKGDVGNLLTFSSCGVIGSQNKTHVFWTKGFP